MEPAETLQSRDTYVNALANSLVKGQSLRNVPGLLKQIIRGDMWRSRIVQQTGETIAFKSFREFVEAAPPEGLHTTIQLLIHICNDFGDMEAVSLISMESAGTAGNPTGANQYVGNVDIIHNSTIDRPSGTSTPATMRRLAKRNPALLAQVVAGELSPNAAAVQAGFRKKNLQVPDDPTRAAQWFRSHKDEGWIGTFVNELVK